ncbi:MAG: antitermination protein NusG [Deltaproteobacteria bacterium RIFCSPLOWO2_12_FULL_60_19]|nr:MAG: antitermination protein NusG [Deltaproteobacteria bacterium RIFCSPLOWO2_12_FULL_60_19]
MELWLFLLRWIHFLAGITWIGLLYYFNFVQTPFFAEAEPAVRSAAIQKLVPRALWWFRWGAMATFIAGILLYIHYLVQSGAAGFYTTAYAWAITLGGTLGTVMFLNVWLVIWPNQQVVIASATQAAKGGQALPEAANCGRRAALTSRTNVVFSIPMLFYMGARHLTGFGEATTQGMLGLVVLGGAIIAAVEANALVGLQGDTKKPLDSVSGALWSGFILTAVFYLLFLVLF